MKLGLGAYAYRWAIGTRRFRPSRPLTAIGLLEKALGLGLRLVQFSELIPLEDFPYEELQEVQKWAKRYDLELEGGTAVNLHHPHKACSRLLRYLEVAQYLGMKLVRVVLEGEGEQAMVEQGRILLEKVALEYHAAGVSLAVENHFRLTSDALIRLVGGLQQRGVGVCLDTVNSIGAGEWPEETVAKLAPYVLSLHLKDYVIVPHPEGVGLSVIGAPLGEGRQALSWIVDRVAQAGRSPNVILELWLPRAGEEEQLLQREQEWVERSVAVAKSLLEKRGRNADS